MIIPVSVIIPTYNRKIPLEATLKSMAKQEVQFAELIVVDASQGNETEDLLKNGVNGLSGKIIYKKAVQKGAASQRNEGFQYASNQVVAFMDDDILFEPGCIDNLWKCFLHRNDIGGVNALIVNEKYEKPGRVTRFMCKMLNGKSLPSYAGKCIGPAWQFLPGDSEGTPEYNPVDWLNLGCTLYRRDALPDPPFQSSFTGYSLMEDLALSLTVGKKWKLFNVVSAKIFHDSQPGDYKSNVAQVAKMELVNRYFIMTRVMERTGYVYNLKFMALQSFGMLGTLRSAFGRESFFKTLKGKLRGLGYLVMNA